MQKSDLEEAARPLIERYRQSIFALIFYLIGDDRDKAYDISSSCFIEAFKRAPFQKDEAFFIITLLRIAVEKSRNVDIIPFSDASDFTDLPPAKRNSLLMVKRALQALSFDERALLLLRDQLHLTYSDIASVLDIPQHKARTDAVHARIRIREKLDEVLSGGGGA